MTVLHATQIGQITRLGPVGYTEQVTVEILTSIFCSHAQSQYHPPTTNVSIQYRPRWSFRFARPIIV